MTTKTPMTTRIHSDGSVTGTITNVYQRENLLKYCIHMYGLSSDIAPEDGSAQLEIIPEEDFDEESPRWAITITPKNSFGKNFAKSIHRVWGTGISK